MPGVISQRGMWDETSGDLQGASSKKKITCRATEIHRARWDSLVSGETLQEVDEGGTKASASFPGGPKGIKKACPSSETGGPSGRSQPLGAWKKDGLSSPTWRGVFALQMFLSVCPSLCLQRLRFTSPLWPKGGRFTLLVVFPDASFQRILERIMRLRGLRDLPWLIPLSL